MAVLQVTVAPSNFRLTLLPPFLNISILPYRKTLGNFAPPYFGSTNSNAPPYFVPMTVPHYTSSEPTA